MKVSEDLSIATAQEINAASIFKNAYFDFNPQKGDLILEGTIKKFRIKTYTAFYGCSFLGVYLWYFGLPTGKIHNDVIIEFQLKDKQGKSYFQKEYTAHTDYLQGLYYNLKTADFEPLVKEINLKLLQDLQTVAPKIIKKWKSSKNDT